MRRIRSHLTYANVIATVALFLVLSGGTAVALSGTDTVQSDDLGPDAQVKAPDVAANAVNGSDVVNYSLTGADIANGSLHYPKFASGLLELVPVAVVLIGGNGSVAEEAHRPPITGPPTVTHDSMGHYALAFPGLSIGGNDLALCTYRGDFSTYGGEIRSVANGELFVNVSNSGGGSVDDSFQCAMYDL
jgi:hypothetical protein